MLGAVGSVLFCHASSFLSEDFVALFGAYYVIKLLAMMFIIATMFGRSVMLYGDPKVTKAFFYATIVTSIIQ